MYIELLNQRIVVIEMFRHKQKKRTRERLTKMVLIMRVLVLTLLIVLLADGNLLSQQFKSDKRIQVLKEDDNNMYKSDLITNLDLIQALEVAGISINKFDLGVFDKKYQFLIIQEEFKDGKRIKSDTLFNDDNTYNYFVKGEKDYYTAYIDQIKIFTQSKDTTFTMNFSTYGMRFKKEIHFQRNGKDSFYNLRSYLDTKWILNEKIPLLVYASSWKDKKWGFQRFCGVVNLSRDDKETDDLLNSSPHYYMISYISKD